MFEMESNFNLLDTDCEGSFVNLCKRIRLFNTLQLVINVIIMWSVNN